MIKKMVKVSFYLEGGIVNTVEVPDKTLFEVSVALMDQANQVNVDFIQIALEKQTLFIHKSKLLMFDVIEEQSDEN